MFRLHKVKRMPYTALRVLIYGDGCLVFNIEHWLHTAIQLNIEASVKVPSTQRVGVVNCWHVRNVTIDVKSFL